MTVPFQKLLCLKASTPPALCSTVAAGEDPVGDANAWNSTLDFVSTKSLAS